MLCPTCNNEIPNEARFCSHCGAPLHVADLDATGALTPIGQGEAVSRPDSQEYALLVLQQGPGSQSPAYQLEPPVVAVGRGTDQQIFLDDITVSRKHAEISYQDQQWLLKDLGSLNGTYVNREPVDAVLLVNGDEIQIGKYRFRFLTGTAASHMSNRGGQ